MIGAFLVHLKANHTLFGLFFALLAISVVGYGIPEGPQEIRISNARQFRPASLKDLQSVEDELAAVITICRDDLGLPVVDPLYLHLYKTSAAFAFYAHPGRHPADIRHQAFARGSEINVDLEQAGDGRLIRLWAHEYAHNLQDRIPQFDSTSAFVVEGFADWVAARVLHILKWQDFAVTRHKTRRELIRHRDLLPDLNLIYEDNTAWLSALNQSMGRIRTYNLAFLTMDRLIEEKGLAETISYLRKGGSKTAFRISLSQVAADFQKSPVESLPKNGIINAARPEWKPGYKWTYVRNDSGSITTVVNEVVGEDVLHGRPVFVVKSIDEEILYDREDFTILGTRYNGKLVREVDKTTGFLSWPLQPRKEWRMTLMEKNLAKNSALQHDQFIVVTDVENVHLGASEFQAIKIEAYGAVTGRLWAEYWYSPKVKWFVKTRTYTEKVGAIEKELSRFELNEK